MNAMRDSDLLIKAFLDDGLDELPERSYDAVRLAIDNIGQRPAMRLLTGLQLPSRPDVFDGRSPAFNWLLAAVLLVAVTVSAVVGGSLLLLRLNDDSVPVPVLPSPTPTSTTLTSPTPSPVPTPAVGTLTVADDPLGAQCDLGSSNDSVLQFVERNSDTNDERFVVVMPNGMVLSGLRSELTFDQGVRQRRLTSDGLQELAAMIDAARIENCQPVANDNPDVSGWLHAWTADDPLVAWFGIPRLSDVRRRSPVEISSITNLFERLRDLDAALQPTSWRDEESPPYVPDQWKLTVRLEPNSPVSCGVDKPPTTDPMPASCLSWGAIEQLPDGTPLLSFGTHYPAVRVNDGYRQGYRCGHVDRQLAATLPDFLDMTAAEGFVGGGYEHTFTGGSEAMTVQLTGVLPGDPGCEPNDTTKPSDTPPSDLAPEIDACDLLRDVVPDIPNDNVGVGFLPMRGGGEGRWTGCIAWPEPGDLGLYVRGLRTSALDAASYVTSLFGQGIQTEQILGRTVYWNDCFGDEADCTPAAAVISEPHLVVFSWEHQNRSDFHSMLERVLETDVIPSSASE